MIICYCSLKVLFPLLDRIKDLRLLRIPPCRLKCHDVAMSRASCVLVVRVQMMSSRQQWTYVGQRAPRPWSCAKSIAAAGLRLPPGVVAIS